MEEKEGEERENQKEEKEKEKHDIVPVKRKRGRPPGEKKAEKLYLKREIHKSTDRFCPDPKSATRIQQIPCWKIGCNKLVKIKSFFMFFVL